MYRGFVIAFVFLCRVRGAQAEECDPARFDTLIRFEWRRSFHSDIDVCVGKRGAIVAIFVTRRARDGTVTLHRDRRLPMNDWSKLERVVANAHLERVQARTLQQMMSQADGATWTIRFDSGAAHRTTEEWAPARFDATRMVGEAMLDLAGRDVIDGEIY